MYARCISSVRVHKLHSLRSQRCSVAKLAETILCWTRSVLGCDDAGYRECDGTEPHAMSTAAASANNVNDSTSIGFCNGDGTAGAEPCSHGDQATSQKTEAAQCEGLAATALHQDMLVDAGGTAGLQHANGGLEEGSTMHDDVDGGPSTIHGHSSGGQAANASAMLASEAATGAQADNSAATADRIRTASGMSGCSTAAANGTGAGCMMSAEAQQSNEGLSSLKSGATEGSMGAVSAPDAGSITLTDGLEAPDAGASAVQLANGGGEDEVADDEDLYDAAAADEECEAVGLPGMPPLDDWSLTEDEARHILGAQVKRLVPPRPLLWVSCSSGL